MPTSRSGRVLHALSLAAVCAVSGVAFAQCDPHWSSRFAENAFDASVNTLFRWDPDGPGPQSPTVLAAGPFTRNGSTLLDGLARWTGSDWAPMGAAIGGVTAITQWDPDGPGPLPPQLVAAGTIHVGTTAGWTVARWDGSDWVPMGAVFGGIVNALAVFDLDGPGPQPPTLIAAGTFTSIGAASINYLAAWDGSAWTALPGGTGPDNIVQAIVVHDDDGPGPIQPALYIGGFFSNAGGIATGKVARFSGSTWSALPDPPLNTVFALENFDDDGPGPLSEVLYIGSTASGDSPRRLLRWDGSHMSAFGRGFDGAVSSLRAIPDGQGPGGLSLYAGGAFTRAGDTPATHIARFDGSNWHRLDGGVNASVNTISWLDGPIGQPPPIIAGGDFTAAGALFAGRVAQWQSQLPQAQSWQSMGSGFCLGGNFNATAVLSFDEDGAGPQPPALIIAGRTTALGASPVIGMARWNGQQWSPLGDGLNGSVTALAAFDADGAGPEPARLLALGNFTASGSRVVRQPAIFDGAQWSTLGSPSVAISNAPINAVAVFDEDGDGPLPPAVFIGGSFDITITSTGFHYRSLAKFNGSAWVPVGEGISGTVTALTVHDEDGDGPLPPRLFAAGSFANSGSTALRNIARWNGAVWSAVGPLDSGPSGGIAALASFDADGPGGNPPELYAGGSFNRVGTVNSTGLAKWNGSAWSAIAVNPPLPPRGPTQVTSLVAGEITGPGRGPLLYVGGNYSFLLAAPIGTPPAANIVGWNGANWVPLGGGVASGVTAMCLHTEQQPGGSVTSLFVSGRFSTVDVPPISSARFAAWSGGPDIAIAQEPAPVIVPPGADAAFTVSAVGPGPLAYQWLRDGLPLTDGPTATGIITGSLTPALHINGISSADRAVYSARVTNQCSDLLSRPASLTIRCALADITSPGGGPSDGLLTGDDFVRFISAFAEGDSLADIVDLGGTPPPDGVVTGDDFNAFINSFVAGCP